MTIQFFNRNHSTSCLLHTAVGPAHTHTRAPSFALRHRAYANGTLCRHRSSFLYLSHSFLQHANKPAGKISFTRRSVPLIVLLTRTCTQLSFSVACTRCLMYIIWYSIGDNTCYYEIMDAWCTQHQHKYSALLSCVSHTFFQGHQESKRIYSSSLNDCV